MTRVVGLLLLMVVLPLNVQAELTKQDLQEIQAMLDKQKQDMKEYIDTKIEAVKESVVTLQWAVGIIGILIVAIVGMPQWITLARERREIEWHNLFETRLEEVRRELDVLKKS
jgi:hypothetical protein